MLSSRRGPRAPAPSLRPRARRHRAPFPVALLAACLVAGTAPPAGAAAEDPVSYRPPVDGPVVDGYRPPTSPFGPGNRGLDYATTSGQPVGAAAEGEVVFAGRIGPSHHVVVLHADGIRTSYSFLEDATVQRGQRVAQGEVVGTAGMVLHFGARAGERYLDPSLLLASGPAQVHLVPVELARPQDEARERSWLVEQVGAIVTGAWQGSDALEDAVGWVEEGALAAAAEARSLAEVAAATGWEHLQGELETLWSQATLLAHYAGELPISPLFLAHVAEEWERAELYRTSQEGCTPASAVPPPPPAGRRIAVVVAGFGSSSTEAEILDVDLASLGYHADDMAQFSYAGGRVPEVGALAGVPTSDYGPEDANGDLRVAGERLARLVDAIAAAHPGVPVDVIAHSQGGVVARLALAERHPASPPVASLVTLGSPHHGTDVATANALVGTTTPGELAQLGVDEVTGTVDGRSEAAAQLAETSDLLAELDGEPLPAGTRVTSIAARGDLTVPGLQSSLAGASNVMVPLDGVSAHADLPGSAVAHREMALALAGRGPTCRSVAGDLAQAAAISMAEDTLGLATGVGALWLDRHLPGVPSPGRRPGPAPAPTPPAPAPSDLASAGTE